jgi:undecaprenyl-diphosphatase
MNDAIQDMVNNLAGRSDLADAIAKFVAQDLIFLAIPLIVALWFLPFGRDRAMNQRLSVLACGGVLIAVGLGALLGHIYFQTRPFVNDHATKLLIAHGADNGFPSDHATVVFALAGAFVLRRRLIGTVLIGTGLVVGLARVYVGVHWPSDILAAVVLGVVVGGIVSLGESLLEPAQAYLSRYLPRALIAEPD